MQPVRLCAFLAYIAVFRCYELSQNLAEFYCVLNGNYSDREQVEKDGANRTAFDARYQPVWAPSLSEVPVFYMEESSRGVVMRANIAIIIQVDDDIIYVQRNNFTGSNDIIRPGTFDANRIKNFTLNDLHGQQDCRNAVERVGAFVFSSDWQNCRQTNDKGQRGIYASTETCNEVTITVPGGAPEKSTVVAYKFKLLGSKYPLENAPGNYTCNC